MNNIKTYLVYIQNHYTVCPNKVWTCLFAIVYLFVNNKIKQ